MARYKQQQQHRLSLLLNVECYTLPVTLHQHLNNLRKLYSFFDTFFFRFGIRNFERNVAAFVT